MIEPTFDINSIGYNIVYSGINAAYKKLYYLINMKKGTDPYNLNKGIDIAKYYYSIEEDNTTALLEEEIRTQINEYTDYSIVSAKCYIKRKDNDKILCIILKMNSKDFVIISTNGDNTSIINSNQLNQT